MVGGLPDVSGDNRRNIISDWLIRSAQRLYYMTFYVMVEGCAD